MSKTYARLGAALDRESYEWLQDANPALAEALQAEVADGAEPEAIERFFLNTYGLDRDKLGRRLKSAARHLKSVSA